MRIITLGVVAVLAILIGLGVGYLLWGQRAAELAQQVQQQRTEFEGRLADQERRARAAEDRARQEAEARRVLEDQLHQVRPQK